MLIIEPYIYLRDNAPLLATFLLLFVVGFITAHLFSLEQISSLFSSVVGTIVLILSILFAVPCTLMLGNQVFSVIFDIFRNGFGMFLLNIVLSVIGFIIGFFPWWIYQALFKAKLKKNPVMLKVYTLTKTMKAKNIACCYDGIYLTCDSLPETRKRPNGSCSTQEEYDYLQEDLTSVTEFCIKSQNSTIIEFATEGYQNMSFTDMHTFAEAFCDLVKNFQYHNKTAEVSFTFPAYRVTTDTPYYIVNGNICGGPSSYEVKETTVKKTLDFFMVINCATPSEKDASPIVTPSQNSLPKKGW